MSRNFPIGSPVRLAFVHGEPIPRNEQLCGVVASQPTANGAVQVTFTHEGAPAFHFWPVDEIESNEPQPRAHTFTVSSTLVLNLGDLEPGLAQEVAEQFMLEAFANAQRDNLLNGESVKLVEVKSA